MQGKLPEKIDPKRLAHQGTTLRGEIPAASLERLGAAFEIRKPASVELHFAFSSERRPLITGNVSARIASTCQRCLQEFETTVSADVDVEIGEAPRDADQDFELVLAADEALRLVDFVEDELLLEAPMIPVHPTSACAAPAAGADETPQEDEGPRRPFAELQDLMDRSKNNGPL